MPDAYYDPTTGMIHVNANGQHWAIGKTWATNTANITLTRGTATSFRLFAEDETPSEAEIAKALESIRKAL